MGDIKTKKNKASVIKMIGALPDPQQRADAKALVKIYREITGQKATMWGTAIIGFGQYHYQSERSSQKGDWPLAAFSPRKQALTLYLTGVTKQHPELFKKLGRYKVMGGCLYIKRLSDIHSPTLRRLIMQSYKEAKKRYVQEA